MKGQRFDNKRNFVDVAQAPSQSTSIELIGITVCCIALIGVIRFSFNYFSDKGEGIDETVKVINGNSNSGEEVAPQISEELISGEAVAPQISDVISGEEVAPQISEELISGEAVAPQISDGLSMEEVIKLIISKINQMSINMLDFDHITQGMYKNLQDLAELLKKAVSTNVNIDQLNDLLENISLSSYVSGEMIKIVVQITQVLTEIATTLLPEITSHLMTPQHLEDLSEALDNLCNDSTIVIHKVDNLLSIISQNLIAHPLLGNLDIFFVAITVASCLMGGLYIYSALKP